MSELTIPKNLLQKKEKTYPVQIATPAEKITEFTVQLDAGLARTNDTANQEAARLQAQAHLLLEQAQLVWNGKLIFARKFDLQAFVSNQQFIKTTTSTKTLETLN